MLLYQEIRGGKANTINKELLFINISAPKVYSAMGGKEMLGFLIIRVHILTKYDFPKHQSHCFTFTL